MASRSPSNLLAVVATGLVTRAAPLAGCATALMSSATVFAGSALLAGAALLGGATLLSGCATQSASAPPPAAPQVEKAPEPPPAPPEEETKPERSVSEVLSVPDKAWVFSFEGSTAYDKAKASCEERFKDDPAGRARCVTKARDTYTADAMEFTRDAAGNDVWVIYKTKSNKLIKVYSVQIEYGEQEGDTLSIKKLGRESGKPLLFSGVSEFKVKLGGEYSLEMEDAKHGVVAYDARLGFITSQ